MEPRNHGMEHQAHVRPDARLSAPLSRAQSQRLASTALKSPLHPPARRPVRRFPVTYRSLPPSRIPQSDRLLGPPKPRSRFTALGEPKIFALFSVSIVQIISLTVGPNGRWHPRICSMTVVWTSNVPDAGTRLAFSIEDRIWDGQRTSVSATVGRTLGASQGVPRQIRARGGGLGDHFKAASLQRHFWARNAPYSLNDPYNPLNSQQMRAPSERTIPTLN